MTDTIGFPEAARRLGVPTRILRRAIHQGKLPAPPHAGATAPLPATWFDAALAAVTANPAILSRGTAQRVLPFARYEGTSCWRKYTNRVREYNRFKAA